MAKLRHLVWCVEDGYFTAYTAKTHQMRFSYDMFADCGPAHAMKKEYEEFAAKLRAEHGEGIATMYYWCAHIWNILGCSKVATWEGEMPYSVLSRYFQQVFETGDTDISIPTYPENTTQNK